MKDRVDRKLCLGSSVGAFLPSVGLHSVGAIGLADPTGLGNLNRIGESVGKRGESVGKLKISKSPERADPAFTFLKPAHTWNRQASFKHAIEQNDE